MAAFDRACVERHSALNTALTELVHEVKGMRDDLLTMREQLKSRSLMARVWGNVFAALIGAAGAAAVALMGKPQH